MRSARVCCDPMAQLFTSQAAVPVKTPFTAPLLAYGMCAHGCGGGGGVLVMEIVVARVMVVSAMVVVDAMVIVIVVIVVVTGH